jgi:tetratricopeptide (TPR) repeat protein
LGLLKVREEWGFSALCQHFQGIIMALPGKKGNATEPSRTNLLARISQQSQLDFEIEFFATLLKHNDSMVEVLRCHAKNLALKGRYAEGLQVDRRLVELRPQDPYAHYNLACTYALLKQRDLALITLRKAVEVGYRDFRYMRQDRDLESIRSDPRFKQLLREFENR